MNRPILRSGLLLALLMGAAACASPRRAASQAPESPVACETDPDWVESQEITAADAPASGAAGVTREMAANENEEEDGEADEAYSTNDEGPLSAPAAPAAAEGAAGPPIEAADRMKKRGGPAQCVVTEETFAADFSRALQTLDVRLGELATTELANCDLACDLAEQICELKDKICNLTGLNPASSIAERCVDAEARCARAEAGASERCGCGKP